MIRLPSFIIGSDLIEVLFQSHHYNFNIESFRKKSQFAYMILTIDYICRTIHSFIIYPQVQNETLLFSIGAYMFYSLMMISVLASIIILIQLKFTKQKNYNYNFISVITLIDSIIYGNKYLKYYFWIMLNVCFLLTLVGILIYRNDNNVQDIVNHQNYVLADLMIAQMVFIFFSVDQICSIYNKILKLLSKNQGPSIQFKFQLSWPINQYYYYRIS